METKLYKMKKSLKVLRVSSEQIWYFDPKIIVQFDLWDGKYHKTNASYLLGIVPIHSVTIMMGAIDRVRSVLTNQMQENILYLCFIGTIESKQ